MRNEDSSSVIDVLLSRRTLYAAKIRIKHVFHLLCAEFPLYYICMFTTMKVLQSVNRDLRQFFWIDVEQVRKNYALDLAVLLIPRRQDTSKRIKLRVFTHLHSLSLNFHLQRKTGEVLKVSVC